MQNKKYAKFENGKLVFAPLNKNNISNWGLNEALVKAEGYMLVIEEPMPEGFKMPIKTYIEQAGNIVCVWKEGYKEPTIEEQVAKLEAETGLTRIMREGILAEGSPYSAYAKEKALEIEELAYQLRAKEDSGATLE